MMTLTPAPLPWREREKGRGGFIGGGIKGGGGVTSPFGNLSSNDFIGEGGWRRIFSERFFPRLKPASCVAPRLEPRFLELLRNIVRRRVELRCAESSPFQFLTRKKGHCFHHPLFGKDGRKHCKRQTRRELSHRDLHDLAVHGQECRHGRIIHRPPSLGNIRGFVAFKGQVTVLMIMGQFSPQAGDRFSGVRSDPEQCL